MNTASYNQREKDLACASCTLASQMKDCKWCMFFDAERNNPRVPTVLDIRTVYDIDPAKKFRVADVMDFGAILHYSVVLYEITDRTAPVALPLSPFAMTAANEEGCGNDDDLRDLAIGR